MKDRKSVDRSKSKQDFRRNARKSHPFNDGPPRNKPWIMRGGIRM